MAFNTVFGRISPPDDEMVSYANLGGDSGVEAYSIQPTAIVVRFSDQAKYTYTYASAGRDIIEQMKQLAEQGSGLNSFISRVVRTRYASKTTGIRRRRGWY